MRQGGDLLNYDTVQRQALAHMDLRLSLIPSRNLVLSGSTGFIGRTILSSFAAEAIRLESLAQAPDRFVLLHLAAMVSGDDGSVLRENFEIDLAASLASNSRLAGIVYASTNNVYPQHAQQGVSYVMGSGSAYVASKRTGEVLIQTLARCPWWIARIGDVFGCRQTHGNLFRAAENSIRESKPIRLIGVGAKVRNYVYAPDLAGALLSMADKLCTGEVHSEVSNLCYPEHMTVAEIVRELAQIASLPIEAVHLPNDVSSGDFRTMTPGPLHGISWRWSMRGALADYVNAIKSEANIK